MSVTYFPGAPHSNSSTSLQTGGSVFGGSKDGMHQRSFSVSSADQWNEAINTSTSSGARKTSTFYILIPLKSFLLCSGGEKNKHIIAQKHERIKNKTKESDLEVRCDGDAISWVS